MKTSRSTWELRQLGGAILGCVVGLSGCATESATPRHYVGVVNVEVIAIEQARELEQSQPDKAKKIYEAFLVDAKSAEEPFAHYQQALQRSMGTMHGSSSDVLTKEDVLGFPHVYARQLEAIVAAHQGLARLASAQGDVASGEAHTNQAITIMRTRSIASSSMARSLRESHRTLQEIYASNGRSGRELIAKMNKNLLQEYLRSEDGVRAFYEDKILLYGETAQKQLAASDDYVKGVNDQREANASATRNAIAGGVMMAGAAIQTAAAQQALVNSGGVMTPQVQQMQMNAQLAQFQVQMFTAMVKMDAGQMKALDVNASPWGLPMFSQQLVDPKMGMSSRGIVKMFAGEAAKAGGTTTLAQGAQQVIRYVDALPTVKTTSNSQAIVKSVESFAGVFNTFLTQVQEIKAGK